MRELIDRSFTAGGWPMCEWKWRRGRSLRTGKLALLLGLAVLGVADSVPGQGLLPVAAANEPSAGGISWAEALQTTTRTGRPSVVLVTSQALPRSRQWAAGIRQQITATFGQEVACAELVAENDPARVESLNVRSLPTALVYTLDTNNSLKLAGYIQAEVEFRDLYSMVAAARSASGVNIAENTAKRSVRVQRVSATTTANATAAEAARDEQVAATTLHAQSSPQNYGSGLPSKQTPTQPEPPRPYSAPPAPTSAPPQTYSAPPAQPQPQPVYAMVPQQPVYGAPMASPPVTVQPPAGQVVVQPSPLNVMVAPTPPPQVTYMAPAYSPPAYSPPPAAAPAYSPPAPAPNAFAAPPAPAAAPAYSPPAAAAPQPAFGAGAPMSSPLGGMAMGMMMTNPNLLDRFIGGLGRLMAERSYPRVRMNPESPSMFSAPMGMGGFVGINPAMAMAPSPGPLQTYMAMPNGGGNGGGDATEEYIKAYIKLCKEKGVTPNLPGVEPPAPPQPTGPVPSPQDQQRKRFNLFGH